MSTASAEPRLADRAALFAALGDPTRLALVDRLADGAPRSITRLAGGSGLTRQAITRHLRVLEDAGMVTAERSGREVRFAFRREPIAAAQSWLGDVAGQWEQALARLKAFVEE